MFSVLKTHSVLYVEDDPDIQANIAEYLREYFASVYLANDGHDAITQYHMYHPDVLILDIELPELDGLSVAKKIREQDQSIKIIMLSAFSERTHLLMAVELKLTKYLIKPFSPKQFKNTLNLLGSELLKSSSRFYNLNGETVWDKEEKKLFVNREMALLAEKERRLLNLLVNNSGNVTSYEKIIISLWDDAINQEISIDSVKNQVSKLRKKLPDGCLTSVYGEGYCLK